MCFFASLFHSPMQNADIHISIFYTNHPCPPLEKEGKAAAHLRKINCGEQAHGNQQGESAGNKRTETSKGNKRTETTKGNKRMEQSRKIIAQNSQGKQKRGIYYK